jgi:hypothetical protein
VADGSIALRRCPTNPLPAPPAPALPPSQKRHLARYNELSPACAGWLLGVPEAEEPTLSDMEEAARTLSGSERWELFEIAVDSWRDEAES